MGISQDVIDEIVRRVTSVAAAEKIILFGSAATGQMNRDSDIDLLILQQTVHDNTEDWLRVQKALMGLGYPFDIIIMTSERFEETKNVIGGIAYPANSRGRVLYEAA
jgi:predicted nucleotidyltransferase